MCDAEIGGQGYLLFEPPSELEGMTEKEIEAEWAEGRSYKEMWDELQKFLEDFAPYGLIRRVSEAMKNIKKAYFPEGS